MKKKIYNSFGFKYKTIYLEESEYAKIVSEINTNYNKYKKEKLCMHFSIVIDGNYYVYFFENAGFNQYNIYAKIFV